MKKWPTLFLALTLIAALTACGSSGAGTVPTEAGGAAEEAEAAEIINTLTRN